MWTQEKFDVIPLNGEWQGVKFLLIAREHQ